MRLVASALLACILASPAAATPPAVYDAIVNLPLLKRLAAASFEPADVVRLERAITAQVRDRSRLFNPAPKPYAALASGGSGAFRAAVKLVIPHLNRRRIAKVEAFLRAVSQRKVFRGRVISRDFGGCTAIRVSLRTTDDDKIEMLFQHAAAPMKNCRVTNSNGTAPGFSYATGVSAAAIGR
jgi:hypothetical protein